MELPVNYNNISPYMRRKVREQYVYDQRGFCYYCGGCLKQDVGPEIKEKRIDWDLFPKNFLKYPVHLHHDHNTGMTIGAVHSYCNAVLWQYHGE